MNPLVCDVIALHGLPGTSADFASLSEALSTADLRLRAVDYAGESQGFGEAALDCVAAAMNVHPEPILLGYSFGAYLAMASVLRRELRPKGLVLISPFLRPRKSIGVVSRLLAGNARWATRILALGIESRVQKFLASNFNEQNQADADLGQADLSARLRAPELWAAALRLRVWQDAHPLPQTAPALGRIPVLALAGDADRVCEIPAQMATLRGLCPNFTQQSFLQGPHVLPWTHAAELSKHIVAFANHGGRS